MRWHQRALPALSAYRDAHQIRTAELRRALATDCCPGSRFSFWDTLVTLSAAACPHGPTPTSASAFCVSLCLLVTHTGGSCAAAPPARGTGSFFGLQAVLGVCSTEKQAWPPPAADGNVKWRSRHGKQYGDPSKNQK